MRPHISARSQPTATPDPGPAAAMLDHQAAGRARVTSAGSQPADELNPAVVAAMAEIGLDISRELPQPLTSDKVQATVSGRPPLSGAGSAREASGRPL